MDEQVEADVRMEIEAGVEEARSCGCPFEYHLSDCSILTISSGIEEDWATDEGRGWDGYGEDD